jgi:hypothetical protein
MRFSTTTGVSDSAALGPGPAALVIAHPGHELRVHGWLEWARPIVFVLTDGSGHSNHGRMASTTRMLERAGASNGSVCARFTDRELYETILEQRVSVFTDLVTELASAFVAGRFEYVVADAAEGYNPGHDLCRYLVDAAVECARVGLPEAFRSFEIDLAAAPDAAADAARAQGLCLELDEAALERKLTAARAYVEMAQEVEAALERWGASAFRHECLRETAPGLRDPQPGDTVPYYESHGDRRRAEGTYEQVIRYREHIRPLHEALRMHAKTARCPA